jgi:hypothetical protein
MERRSFAGNPLENGRCGLVEGDNVSSPPRVEVEQLFQAEKIRMLLLGLSVVGMNVTQTFPQLLVRADDRDSYLPFGFGLKSRQELVRSL